MNVSDAASSGDKLELLYALRGRIAAEIEDCPANVLSPLTRRLQDIVTEIDAIEERKKEEEPSDGRGKRTGGGWDPAEL